MRKAFYLIFIIFFPAISFSQATGKDSTAEQTLKALCDNKFFVKCEIPVDFKYGKKALEDSLTNYLKGNNSQFQNGKATFYLIVAKNSKVYSVSKKSGTIVSEGEIIKALQLTSDLWTIGKQNSHPICSYVTLELNLLMTGSKLTC